VVNKRYILEFCKTCHRRLRKKYNWQCG